MGCVYVATNLINGKKYIGWTYGTLSNRRKGHEAISKKGFKIVFQMALRKYGVNNFSWKILCSSNSEAVLKRLEISFIAALKTRCPNGYNMTDGGDGTRGHVRTEDEKRRISEKMKGRIAGDRNPSKRPEVAAKISKSLMGRKLSKEHVDKVVAWRKGWKISEIGKQNISKSKKGKKFSEAHKAALREAWKIRKQTPVSEVAKKNRVEGLKRYYAERKKSP